jgi:hypothetical protein
MLKRSKESVGRLPRIQSNAPHSGHPKLANIGHQTRIPSLFFVCVIVLVVKSGMLVEIKVRPGGSVVIVEVTTGLYRVKRQSGKGNPSQMSVPIADVRH